MMAPPSQVSRVSHTRWASNLTMFSRSWPLQRRFCFRFAACSCPGPRRLIYPILWLCSPIVHVLRLFIVCWLTDCCPHGTGYMEPDGNPTPHGTRISRRRSHINRSGHFVTDVIAEEMKRWPNRSASTGATVIETPKRMYVSGSSLPDASQNN